MPNELQSPLLTPMQTEAVEQLPLELDDERKPVNVAQVKHLSPFRYPGGKTWLVPEVSKWLASRQNAPDVLVEPFAGGAMVGLTAIAEGLVPNVTLSELDDEVAAVWETIFNGTEEEIKDLSNSILTFEVTLENVQRVLTAEIQTRQQRAFRTILRNRMQRGGIMAAGAGLVKAGESGKGLTSRWYPVTLVARIGKLRTLRNDIAFLHGDAFATIEQFAAMERACFFVDPPYTVGGKKAGARLYTHSDVNHEALFAALARVRGSVMLTYDDAPEVRALAALHKFRVRTVPMKNTHHEIMHELLILKT